MKTKVKKREEKNKKELLLVFSFEISAYDDFVANCQLVKVKKVLAQFTKS
jgi:hypothetical protein